MFNMVKTMDLNHLLKLSRSFFDRYMDCHCPSTLITAIRAQMSHCCLREGSEIW